MTPGGTTGDVETLRQLILRWGLAAMFVVLAHGGVALAIAYWPEPEEKAGEPPAAVMIELAPLPVAPETPPQEVAVGVQQEMSDQSTPNDAKEEPVDDEPPQPEVEVAKSEPLPDPPLEPVERDVETETPKLPQIADAEAVLDAPVPPPPQEVIEKKPEQEEKKKKPELKKKPKPKQSSVAKSASAPKPVEAQRANTNAAPTAGVGATMSISTWRGSVMAHLNRHKRYPGSGGGTSSVAFTIDRSGRVLSARLIRSSGSSILDQEAVALARRASPLPAPPANVGGGSVVLTVPVRFSR